MENNTKINSNFKSKFRTDSDLHHYLFIVMKKLISDFLKDNNRVNDFLNLLSKDLLLMSFQEEVTNKFNIAIDFRLINGSSLSVIVDDDILGEIYNQNVSKKWKRTQGHYLTPLQITKWMVKQSNIQSISNLDQCTILDPSIGTGRFFISLFGFLNENKRLAELNIENLIGFDIDPFSIFISRINLSIQYILLMNITDYSEQRKIAIKISNSILNKDFLNPSTINLNRYIFSPNSKIPLLDKIYNKISPFENGISYIFCNPPYNKIHLTEKQQRLFKKS